MYFLLKMEIFQFHVSFWGVKAQTRRIPGGVANFLLNHLSSATQGIVSSDSRCCAQCTKPVPKTGKTSFLKKRKVWRGEKNGRVEDFL